MLRSLRHSKALFTGTTLTLAAGVGALTLAFGIARAALFRAPPFPDAGRITMLYLVRHPEGEPSGRARWSFPRATLLAERQRSFERIAHYTTPALTLSGTGSAELVNGELVSPSYFPLLGTVPIRGRVFAESEGSADTPGEVALISSDLWRRHWGSAPGILGTQVRLNAQVLTIVGILPPGFHGLSGKADVWAPSTMAPRLYYGDYLRTNQNFISAVGRLRSGVTLAEANAELAVLGGAINRAVPSDEDHPLEEAQAEAVPINSARTDPRVRRSMLVLLGAVFVLHLLAAANVTNLLLGRAAARRREAAVRVALGSGAGRLFRHLLALDLVLVLPGALLGVALAWLGSSVLVPPANVWSARNFYGSIAPFDTPAFSAVELGFGLILALVTALLVALPSALSALGIDVRAGITASSRGSTGHALTIRRPSLRGVLVTLEAALAVMLVVSAGLLLDSFRRMRQTPLGVNTQNVLTFWVIPSEAQVPPATAGPWVTRLLDALQAVPGVVSATVDGGALLSGTARGALFIAGRPMPAEGQEPPVLRHYVAPDHFSTLGIPIIRGRAFGPGDVPGAPKVTVISETAARRFWPNEDPIGRRVWFTGSAAYASPDSTAEVIGIVGDVMYEPLDRQPNTASFYTPYQQFTYASRAVFLKTRGDPLALVPEVRKAIRAVAPDVAMRDIQTLDEVVNGSWARTRFESTLFAGFGAMALLLAASGIFAVLAYVVAGRTREFGIRIALGADGNNVMRLVLLEGLAFPVLGLVLGVGAAVGATRVLRASLYEVSPLEPRVFLATLTVLLVAAVTACLVPAWRATRADPLEVMRAE